MSLTNLDWPLQHRKTTERMLGWKKVFLMNISPPPQFKRSPPKVPYKAIALATVLFLIGSLLIIIGSLLLAGYFGVTVSVPHHVFTILMII